MIFGDIANRLDNRQRALSLFGEHTLDRVEEGFRSETDPEGRAWQPLNKHYAKYRKKGPSILTEDGALRGGVEFRTSRNQMIAGPQHLPYEQIHQKGGVAGFGARIPARPYIGATKQDANVMALTLMAHIRGLTDI